jgi:hypothetical protein
VSRERQWLIDIGVAVLVAALVLILSPGAAITAMIILLALVVCGIGALWSHWRRPPHAMRRGQASGRGPGQRGRR